MQYWHVLTRLGEAQILLPLALLCMLLDIREVHTRAQALRWAGVLLTAAGVTTLTKLAFIGCGIGSRAWDFTGISGHALFAAAVYPVAFDTARAGASPQGRWRWLAVACGAVLALVIGISRVEVGAHSPSEVAVGLVLGGAVAAAGLARPAAMGWRLTPLYGVGAALWLMLMPIHSPASPTHELVTRLALRLSGHSQPCTRADLMHGRVPDACRCSGLQGGRPAQGARMISTTETASARLPQA